MYLNKKNFSINSYKRSFLSNIKQKGIRECQKNENRGKRKFNYINPIKKKIDVTCCILTGKKEELGLIIFFISKKGFKNLGKLKSSKNKYFFERMFEKHPEIKILGILKNKVSTSRTWKIVNIINLKIIIKRKNKNYFF